MLDTKKKAKAMLECYSDDPRHGTVTGYTYGCMCDSCKQAAKKWRKRRGAYLLRTGKIKHGCQGYNNGCRCGICKAAHSERMHALYIKRKAKNAT